MGVWIWCVEPQKMTWGKTESYRLFTWKRHMVVDFDLYMRSAFLLLLSFFRKTSLAKTSYHVDTNDVSMIGDWRFVMTNVSQFWPSNYVDAENVSAIDDLLYLSSFVIYILDFTNAKNVSAMLKNYIIDHKLSINDRWKSLSCLYFRPFMPCY